MNTTSDTLAFERALGAIQQRVRRHTWWQMALYAWFAAVSVAAMAFVGWILMSRGAGVLAEAWPALLGQAAAAGILVAVLRNQAARVRSLQAHGLPVRAAAELQHADLARQRRQSVLLLTAAAVVTPALLFAVARLGGTGVLGRGQGWQLAVLVMVPFLVIVGVHGSRLVRAARAQRQIETSIQTLDRGDEFADKPGAR